MPLVLGCAGEPARSERTLAGACRAALLVKASPGSIVAAVTPWGVAARTSPYPREGRKSKKKSAKGLVSTHRSAYPFGMLIRARSQVMTSFAKERSLPTGGWTRACAVTPTGGWTLASGGSTGIDWPAAGPGCTVRRTTAATNTARRHAPLARFPIIPPRTMVASEEGELVWRSGWGDEDEFGVALYSMKELTHTLDHFRGEPALRGRFLHVCER